MQLSRVLLATLLVLAAASTGQAAEQPNLVIMIADDVGWNDLGCYGHPNVRTPSLDRLARDGMRFDNAFLTCSSCSPSRCSILTGRYPHSTGAAELHQPLPASQVMFPSVLRKAGYYTASAGKWHLGKPVKDQFDRVIEGGRPSGCEHWLTVLKERPKEKPFFLWLAAIDAHRPYAPKAIEKPHTLEDAVIPPFLPDVPETRRDLALYYDEITRLDDHVGQVLAELQRQGVSDNTLVLFLSDNGRPFPRCKTTVYDSGIKTPFIVHWPGHVKPGSVCDSLVSSVDIAPTFVELAGQKKAPTFQGVSFAPLLSNPKATVREHIFGEHNWHDYQAHQRAARSKQYLYIRNGVPDLPNTPPADAVRSITYQKMIELEKAGKLPLQQRDCFIKPRGVEELYDVQTDPYSLKNLASSREHGKTMQEMRKVLDSWMKETEDRAPEKLTPDRFDRTTGESLGKK